jgi:cytochrome c556
LKKIIVLLSLALFASAILSFAADDAKKELRPAQKLMQARKAWLTAINENLRAKNFVDVAKDADALAAQAKKVSESLTNPLAKELDTAVASLAMDVSAAAANQDSDTVKAKLGTIKDKCGECHDKIRDKQ